MRKLFLFASVLCLALLFVASAFARDARLDYLVSQGKLTEEEIAAAEMEGPTNWMAREAYDVYICGIVQPWAKYMDGADPDSAFGLHRARLQATGMLGDIWSFVIQTELAGNVQVLNAGVGVNLGEGQLRVGQFKVPLVLENLTSAATLDTISRSTIAGQVDIRDIGAFLSYPFMEGKVGLDAAVTNGTGLNTNENNNEKDYTVRVWAKPFQGSENPADGLMVAGAYNMGARQMVDLEGLVVGDFDRTRYVGTVQWVWNEIKLQGEYINIEQDLAAGGSAESKGWYVYGTYDLPMDSMIVTPVVKWEEFDPDPAASLCACGGNWITLGVRLSFVGTNDVKLEANYVLEDLDEGEDIDEIILQLTASF